MKTMSARDAKTHFGEFLDAMQRVKQWSVPIAVLAALNHVVRLMGNDKAWESSHIYLITLENQVRLEN